MRIAQNDARSRLELRIEIPYFTEIHSTLPVSRQRIDISISDVENSSNYFEASDQCASFFVERDSGNNRSNDHLRTVNMTAGRSAGETSSILP